MATTHQHSLPEPAIGGRNSAVQADQIAQALDSYLQTLPPYWARILAGYHIIDIAHKVVGVGSVGLRAYTSDSSGT